MSSNAKPPDPAHAPGKTWSVGTLTYTSLGLCALFFWLLFGDFAWSIKERSIYPVVQLLFKRFEATDMLTGLLLGSLPGAIALLVGPIISYKSDRHRGRWGRRIPFLFIPTLIGALAMVGLAFSPRLGEQMHQALGAHSPGLNPSILIFFGLFWTLFEFSTLTVYAVFGALINDVVPQPLLGRFYGLFRACSLIAGMIFNFWIMGKAEEYYVWIFLGMGAIYGVGFTMMCLKVREGEYPPPPPVVPGRGLGFVLATKRYFKECFGHSYYLWFFGAMALSIISFTPINLFGLFFAKSIEMDMSIYGKCLALTYLVSLFLSYPLGVLVDRFHPLRVGLVAQAVYLAVTLLGGLYAVDSQSFAIAFVAHGVVSGTYLTATASVWQRLLPPAEFATFASAGGLINSLTGMCVGPLTGAFLDHANHTYRYTFLISCGLTALALGASLIVHGKFMALGGPRHYVAPCGNGS